MGGSSSARVKIARALRTLVFWEQFAVRRRLRRGIAAVGVVLPPPLLDMVLIGILMLSARSVSISLRVSPSLQRSKAFASSPKDAAT